MTTHRVVLLRHGESEWNAQRRWQGQGGEGLTARGRSQAALTAAYLARVEPEIVGIVHSDLSRVVQTAEPCLRALEVPVLEEPDWREIDVGTWSGKTHAQVERDEPEAYAAWRSGDDVRLGGGETDGELRSRIAAALETLTIKQPEGTVVVFTHGGPIRVAAAEVMGLPGGGHRRLVGVGNCSATVVQRDEDCWRLVAYNERGHLAVEPSDAPHAFEGPHSFEGL